MATTTTQARTKVLDWERNTKIKTCKCTICGLRVKVFHHKCAHCRSRVCSECSEADGISSDQHKAIATDYLNEGCWCGFSSGFNTAFKDAIPPPPMVKQPAKPPTTLGKRKRALPTPDDNQSLETSPDGELKSRKPSDADEPAPSPRAAVAATVTRPTRTRTRPSRYAGPPAVESPPPAKKAERVSSSSSLKSAAGTPNTTPDSSPPAKKGKKGSITIQVNQFPSNDTDISETLPPAKTLRTRKSAADQYPSPDSTTIDTLDTLPPAMKSKKVKRLAGQHPVSQTEFDALDTAASTEVSKNDESIVEQQSTTPGTVIVGAGVIGLFVALELAEKLSAGGTAHDITVIDINEGPSQLASGHCAGRLIAAGIDEKWQSLQEVSTTQWKDLLANPDFCKAAAFSDRVYELSSSGNKEVGTPISWVRDDSGTSCSQDFDAMGTINPTRLGRWLQKHCKHLGVQFIFNTQPTGVQRDEAGDLTGLYAQQIIDGTKRYETLPCSRVVVAAGPFSPKLLQTLFPDLRLALESHALLHQWLRIQDIEISRENNVSAALTLPDTIDYTGPVQFAARRDQSTIEVSRCYRLVPEYRLDWDDAVRKRIGRTTELRQLAANVLNARLPGNYLDDIGGSHQGAYLVSTGNQGNPVIGKVPDWATRERNVANNKSGDDHATSEVWLAYGFGNHGTTLAPGVGKLLVQAMSGEQTGTDLYDFAVTELEKEGRANSSAKAPSKGKGKDKAM